jgi:GntR family transcriptional regulator of arabinose operon
VNNFDSLRIPKYVQLMIRLKEQIEEGVLNPGDPLPTREKLMREHGLSLSTVTRAISELERQGWLISRQGSGTFVVKRNSNNLKQTEEIPLVGLLLPVDRPKSQQLVTEIVHEGMEHNIQFVVMYAPNDEEAELNQARLLFEREVKSIVWFPVEPKCHVSVASLFGKNQCPVILGEKMSEQIAAPCTCVRIDYYGGTRSALEHLIQEGHRRIAYVGPRGNESDFGPIMERWNAYKDTMKEMDMWYPHELIFSPALFREWHVHVEQIGSMFRGHHAPTAVIGYDDSIALEVIRALSSLGIQVPDNISVIGHDDHASGQYSSPRLSTVSPCISEYVDHIIRTLKVSLGLEPAEDDLNNREIVVPQRLLLRESTIQSDDIVRKN